MNNIINYYIIENYYIINKLLYYYINYNIIEILS